MTTPRRRRNRDEQIRDLLEAKLTKEEASAADWKAGWEHKEWECERTRRALALLGTKPLPGFEALAATPALSPEPAAVSVGIESLARALSRRPQHISVLSEPSEVGTILFPPEPCPWKAEPHQHWATQGSHDRKCVTP